MVFIQHGNTIFNWIHEDSNTQDLKEVSKTSSNTFYLKNNHEFFFLLDNHNEQTGSLEGIQTIMKINIHFSQFELITAYREFSSIHKIKSFNFDQGTNRFIILYKNLKESSLSQSENFYFFKIFDIGSK